MNTHRNCAYEMGHNVCIFHLYAFWRFQQWNCVLFFPIFFLLQKAVTELSFFSSQYFHLYLRRPGVLLKLVGRCRFGGGGGSESLSSLGSFFCEAEDYRKETWERGQLSFALRRQRVSGQGLEAAWSSAALHQPASGYPPCWALVSRRFRLILNG